MASGAHRTFYGTVLGTGAAIDVKVVGFRPSEVEIFNRTSRVGLKWTETMADAAALKTAANGDRTVVTTNAITPLASGFTVGTDSVNASGEILDFIARG
jgi:hypothetical protein